jgi:CSLREA domain-containing protein
MPARASTINVDTTADAVAADGQCSLREAITAANTDAVANPGAGECAAGQGADTVELGAGTWLSSALCARKSLTGPTRSKQRRGRT